MAEDDGSGNGGGSSFPPVTYNTSADEAAAKRAAARKFDEWAGSVSSLQYDSQTLRQMIEVLWGK